MKAQFGKQQLINVSTVKQNGLGVVAAEAYRVVSQGRLRASERLSPGCRCSGRSMRSLRHARQDRLQESIASVWWSSTQRVPATIDPGAAAVSALPACDSRLPAPAWAAFVLNHALCG